MSKKATIEIEACDAIAACLEDEEHMVLADETSGCDGLQDLGFQYEESLSTEVDGANSSLDDLCEKTECKELANEPLRSQNQNVVCQPETIKPESHGKVISELNEKALLLHNSTNEHGNSNGATFADQSHYLPPPFGVPAEEDLENRDDFHIPNVSPHSHVSVQLSPVSSECSDHPIGNRIGISDLRATGVSSCDTYTKALAKSPPKLLKSSPEDTCGTEAIMFHAHGNTQSHRRRRKTVQIANPDTYQCIPSNFDNAQYGPFGDYGNVSDVDFVDVNSNELNNNIIRIDNANPVDNPVADNYDEIPQSPAQRPNGFLCSDEAYYDTVSSTSSTAALLKRMGKESNDIDSLVNEQLGKDADLRLGQILLNKTLEQVKKSLEEISPTLDTVIAPIGSSAKLMRIYLKNLIVLSVGFMFSFVAFFALRNLQSSINHASGVGLASLACMYATFIVGCLTATVVIQLIRPKFCILIFITGNLVYIGANIYPKFYILLPATAILGFCQAYLWIAQGTYLTSIAVSYAVAARKRPEYVLGLFNGFFLFLLQISQIFGNLISSTVFSFAIKSDTDRLIPVIYMNKSVNPGNVWILNGNQSFAQDMEDKAPFQYYISALYPKERHTMDTSICGAAYCHIYPIKNHTLDIDFFTITVLLSIFAVLTMIGIIILAAGLNKLDVIFHKSKMSFGQQLCTIGRLHMDMKLVLPIVLMVFLGLEEAFMYGEITKAFITCPLGVHMVGYVMMCFGACNAVGSFIVGQLQNCLHRMVIFTFGAVWYLSLICVMMLWIPTEEDYVLVFILVGALGFGDALWQTQICSLVGLLFTSSDREAAFASLRMYESVGFCIAFSYAQFLCLDVKLFIMGGILFIGMTNYFLMEYILGRNGKEKEEIPTIVV